MGNKEQLEEQERELREFDGTRPDETVGAEECDADALRCETKAGEGTGGVEESEHEAMEEIFESFPVEPIPVIMDKDGLPTPVTGDPEQSLAIPFTYETQLCIEDDREYVELFTEEFSAPPDGRGYFASVSRYTDQGEPVERRRFDPSQVKYRWGVPCVAVPEYGGLELPVRPRRERCQYYKRQVFSNDSQPDADKPGHQIIFRVCTMRRSNGGALMSLRDEAVYACDFRLPPDPESSRRQDEKDRTKLQQRPDLVRLPLFGQPGDMVVKQETSK